MDPYYSNSLLSFQGFGTGCVHPSQSFGDDSGVTPFPQGSASVDFLPIVSQQPYALAGFDGRLSEASQTSRTRSIRSSSHSVGSTSTRTASSVSSHPYQQAKLRHRANQPREWDQPYFPSASVPEMGGVSYAAPDDAASTFCYDLSPLSFLARRFSPPASSGSASQSNIVVSNRNQNMSSPMGSLTISGQTFLSTTPSLPSPTADQADVEYAQDRYGGKRCFYLCRFDLSGSPCNKWIVGDRTRVLRHLRNHHHLQTGPATPAGCRWEKCTHTRPMKQENLSRHVVMHLGVKWKCPHCRRLFSRDDAVHRHIERMVPGMDVTDAEVVPGREARALNEAQCRTARIA